MSLPDLPDQPSEFRCLDLEDRAGRLHTERLQMQLGSEGQVVALPIEEQAVERGVELVGDRAVDALTRAFGRLLLGK